MPLAIQPGARVRYRIDSFGNFFKRLRALQACGCFLLATLISLALRMPAMASPNPVLLVASLVSKEGNVMSLSISSPSFSSGGDIPKKFTCDGADVSPQLAWTEPPAGTKSLALLVDDVDAPVGNWNHWTLWNLPASARSLAEGISKQDRLPDGTQQGRNDFRKTGYNGPCPPPGKPHRYYFKLFALDTKLDLKAGAGKHELESAMKQHILAQAEWMGRYGR
jgi:Raf kinase inhibitor-like YbhB/YbcL family protein